MKIDVRLQVWKSSQEETLGAGGGGEKLLVTIFAVLQLVSVSVSGGMYVAVRMCWFHASTQELCWSLFIHPTGWGSSHDQFMQPPRMLTMQHRVYLVTFLLRS